MNNLTPADLQSFQRLGITPSLLEQAHVTRVIDKEARDQYGIRGNGDMTGVIFPYLPPVANNGHRWTARLRRDNPDMEDGKPKRKYVSAYGDRKHLYFPPGCAELAADVTVPIVLVEAEKSVLALSAWAERLGQKILPVGLGGVWGWKGRIGKTENADGQRVDEYGALPDLSLCRDGRRTLVLLDANCASNPQVQIARRDLAKQLRKQGADVRVLDLPQGDDVNGPDDYIAAQGDQAMVKVMEGADTGSAILEDVEAFLRRFVVMSDSQFTATGLWIAHTYAFEVAIWTPYLEVSSAEKRSGKSRLLEVVSYIAREPWNTSNASTASLFRKIDQAKPTLLFDELDAVFKGDPETAQAVRGVLNAGAHCRGTVARCVGQGTNVVSKDFSVFCPKALAGIGRLPDTVADRSVHIRLKRKSPGRKVERLRERFVLPSARPLRERLADWIGKQLPALKDATPELPDELNDRQQDGAEPLLAIADAAGGDWPGKARRALVELYTGSAADDQSPRTLLLSDIRDVFDQAGTEKISSVDLVAALVAIETSPWAEWSRGHPLTVNGLARLLKPFEVYPKTVRTGTGTPKGYDRDSFLDSWETFLPRVVADPPSSTFSTATPPQATIHAGPEYFSKPQQTPECCALKSEKSSINTGFVAVLRPENGKYGHAQLALPCEAPIPAQSSPGNGAVEVPTKPTEDLYEQAVELAIKAGQVAVSMLVGNLAVTTGQAICLIDRMQDDGVVGAAAGSGPRKVLRTATLGNGTLPHVGKIKVVHGPEVVI